MPAGVKKLQLTFENTAGQVRNLRVLQPGYSLDTAPTFTTDYLNLLKLVSPNTLRLMDFVQTNNNPVVNWSDRTEPTDATQTKVAVPGDLQASKGIAWEYAIDLANAVHKDVWVNIPIAASDDYVRSLAALLRDRLAPDLNIYVEYSNEVWNTFFNQYQYNLDLAKAEVAANPSSDLKFNGATSPDTWANRRYARRAKQVSDNFRAAWTGAGQERPDQHPRAGHPRRAGVEPGAGRRRADVPEPVYGARRATSTASASSRTSTSAPNCSTRTA